MSVEPVSMLTILVGAASAIANGALDDVGKDLYAKLKGLFRVRHPDVPIEEIEESLKTKGGVEFVKDQELVKIASSLLEILKQQVPGTLSLVDIQNLRADRGDINIVTGDRSVVVNKSPNTKVVFEQELSDRIKTYALPKGAAPEARKGGYTHMSAFWLCSGSLILVPGVVGMLTNSVGWGVVALVVGAVPTTVGLIQLFSFRKAEPLWDVYGVVSVDTAERPWKVQLEAKNGDRKFYEVGYPNKAVTAKMATGDVGLVCMRKGIVVDFLKSEIVGPIVNPTTK